MEKRIECKACGRLIAMRKGETLEIKCKCKRHTKIPIEDPESQLRTARWSGEDKTCGSSLPKTPD